MSTDRVKTGIKGLDEMLAVGYLPQTANLVEGPPGPARAHWGCSSSTTAFAIITSLA